jgi:23S rRNA (guanosine2251-2'-O)-methyltransferase
MLISGFHSVEAEILAGNVIKIIAGKNAKRLTKILSLVKQNQIEYKTKDEITQLLGDDKHQGIIAEIKTTNLGGENELKHFLKEQKQLVLILDNITDTRNLGACLRSAVAFGVDCVVIPSVGSANISHNTYKTSAGTLSKIKIFSVANLARTIKLLKEHNFWVVGLDGYAKTKINDYDFSGPHAIVMGAEDKGLRDLTKKNCDNLVKIPMSVNAESLNIAVAAGISLFSASNL